MAISTQFEEMTTYSSTLPNKTPRNLSAMKLASIAANVTKNIIFSLAAPSLLPLLRNHAVRRFRFHMPLTNLLPIRTQRCPTTLDITLLHSPPDVGRGILIQVPEKCVGSSIALGFFPRFSVFDGVLFQFIPVFGASATARRVRNV